MNKAIIFVDKDVQEEEFIYPYYRLQEADYIVDVSTPQVIEVRGKYGIPIKSTIYHFEAQPENYKIVIIPGGWAAERLRQDKYVLKFVKKAHDLGKIIGAICHGPQVLISAGLAKGRKMTCYVGMKDDLVNAGSTYLDVPVVRDGNIITSPHYRNNPDFMRKILEL